MSSAATVLGGIRSTLTRLAPPAGGRPLGLYAVYTLVLLVLFLVASFPYDLAVTRALEDATGGSMIPTVTGARPRWPLAVGIDDLRLVPRGSSEPAALSVQALHVSPSLLGLLRGTPFPVGVEARLYGGTVAGVLDPRPASFDVDASVTGLDLARYDGLAHFSGGALRGRVNLTLALRGDWSTPETLDGRVALTAIGLGLEGLDVRGVRLPDLHFGQLQAGGTVLRGRLNVSEIRGTGTEVDVTGNGHILLRAPLGASLVNLAVTLTPTADAPDGLRMAVQLIPGTAGPNDARVLQISGSLGAPTLR